MVVWIDEAFSQDFIMKLWEEEAAGYVRRQTHPDDDCLMIHNYTEKAVFDRHWNEVTLNCRGLILAVHDGLEYSIEARPFKKFFNYGEQDAPVFDLMDKVEVTDKLDGSLGIMYFDIDGEPAIATRGSFASDQAVHGTEILRSRYYDWAMTRSRKWTLLFEIVYPENRIVVDYEGMDDLVSLGAVNMLTGESRGPLDMSPMPYAKTFEFSGFGEALAAEPRPGMEGFVVRKLGTEERVKLKQEDYIQLHKIVTNLNERAVWEILRTGQGSDAWIAQLPDEFHEWAKDVRRELLRKYQEINQKIDDEFDAIYMLAESDSRDAKVPFRKAFAGHAQTTPNAGFLFSKLDGKDYGPKVWEMIKPAANQGPHGRASNDS